MTSKFTRLDEGKGTLRILLALLETQPHITKTQLIETLHKAELGRSGFYSSYNTLKDIGLITEETAMAYASRKGVVGRGLDSVKSARGEVTTDIEELKIDTSYGKEKDPFAH